MPAVVLLFQSIGFFCTTPSWAHGPEVRLVADQRVGVRRARLAPGARAAPAGHTRAVCSAVASL